ncbi:acyl-CoA/acyl-ACP dehydrogenase [Streptomyces sp. NBC_01808]|uniref:acyl-CoA dehydrogenase family protein n=1 Tax=Streptomyces sp. NBC_01808 TaxID=2975947 RepID=UPI002DDB4369|nr:acyl-CoA dehydrogenase family protein [Streptomyces sp. NBC_01808]WSA41832.1 acyl-CoA/acyl-ACP dehydrogenase [Streptomyces sp. NBC_01808]
MTTTPTRTPPPARHRPPPPDPARLRAAVEEYARAFRATALAMDEPGADPRTLNPVVHDAYFPVLLGLPPAYNPDPLIVDGRPCHLHSCVERVVVYERLAWGDAALMVAAPGPSLSGVLTEELGDDDQKERYYTTLAARPTWTFFALTEPHAGSDATALTTALTETETGAGTGTGTGTPAPYRLSGVKKYIGNAVRAGLGVVFARIKPGPVGVVAVLVEPTRPGFTATALPTTGMRAIGLSEIRLDGVPVARSDILGMHLSATRRGIVGAMRTFNRARPVVAAMALGIAQAAWDYAADHRRTLRADESYAMDALRRRLAGTRRLVLAAAEQADRDPGDGTVASAAKYRAAELALETAEYALGLLGPGARLEHPLLDKLHRDARAFEFMEGTGTMQRLNLALGHRKGRILDD